MNTSKCFQVLINALHKTSTYYQVCVIDKIINKIEIIFLFSPIFFLRFSIKCFFLFLSLILMAVLSLLTGYLRYGYFYYGVYPIKTKTLPLTIFLNLTTTCECLCAEKRSCQWSRGPWCWPRWRGRPPCRSRRPRTIPRWTDLARDRFRHPNHCSRTCTRLI